ncbi:MAG: DUF502 domain-containing protein [Spirochaetales bacterium]|jgi:uncharacterized membrane protein|nr:DUF502 domain-containing protein [Spirochaetales bacterium]
MKRFKAMFYEGLVFIVPAALTCWVFYKIFTILYRFIAAGTAFIPLTFYREYPWLKNALEGAIVALMLLGILIAGMTAETIVGRFLRKRCDTLFKIIPFINFFYDICKQIFDILFMKSEKLLSHPVIVPFPHAGKRAIGFMTGRAEPELALGEEYAKVYIPTVPFPTTGFLMVFPKSQIIENNLSVEQALRLILSGGILEEEEPGKPKTNKTDNKKTPNRKNLFTWLKSRFITGMLLFFPPAIAVYITMEICRYIYSLMKFSIRLIPPRFGHLPYIDELTPIVSFFVLISGTWFIGLIVKTYIGKMLRGHVYSLISYVPFAGALFHAFRQLMNAAFSDSPKTFSKVVLVDFPSPGSKAIGFITGEASAKLADPLAGPEEQYKVFIPGTPNVASGFLVIVSRRDIILTELAVEEGLLRVVSGGLLKQASGIGGKKKNDDPPAASP